MRFPIILTVAAALGLTGCYTQLASGNYARRSMETTYGYAAVYADSAAPDSLAAQTDADDTLYRPATVIVNNYWRESPYYRGYAIDDWDYPGFTLGFYSSGYRAYQGAWWWDRRHHGYHRDYRYRSGYGHGNGGGYHGGTGGGTLPPGPSGPSGNYQSDKRIFAPEPERAQPRKGRRSESASETAPAPKAAVSNPDPAPATPAASSGDSDDRDSSPSESKTDRPRPQKGKRR